jgi:hypothetical protein
MPLSYNYHFEKSNNFIHKITHDKKTHTETHYLEL